MSPPEPERSPISADEKVAFYASQYPFELDPFQVEALEALAREESVLVAAPTGSGKTVIGEFAAWLALREGGKAFYTTPLKALSNQKFGDFVALHGPERVGLLTGDNAINPRAPVVVMTTEVLRNMIYERSDLLEDLHYVVLDEVHYLQDPYRGAVWEEVIIHLPVDVKIVCLSATVSNAEEFADWIETLRGPTWAVIEERRPVSLQHHYLLDHELFPMFVTVDGERLPNPEIRRIEGRRVRAARARAARRGGPGPRRRQFPRRTDVVDVLSAQRMLPAIYFIFSRKGCDAAVAQCMREGLVLTNAAERARIREFAELRCSYLGDADLEVLGYGEWLEALAAGFAAHHAGHIPVFKEAVEELFQAGLVKVVFATETLSLGINMPAKSVVIESLTKFTGERHEVMTPGEFTQLTGRAGRRGIDTLGHAVVLRQADIPFDQIAGLASTRTYPLISSFQPSYNMATNLVRNYSRDEAEHLLNSSFAQYRADKDVVVLERLIERNEAYLASYHEKMVCDRGDFHDYWRLHERVGRLEGTVQRLEEAAGREQTRAVLAKARPGQVFVVSRGRARGPVVVVASPRSRRGEPQVLAVNRDRRLIRVGTTDFREPPRPVGDLRSLLDGARSGTTSHDVRKRLAGALENLEMSGETSDPVPASREAGDLTESRASVLGHPCHRCPDRDRHSQWAERAGRLEREIAGLRKRVQARTETISRTFGRVLTVLEEHGHIEDFNLSDKGWFLARIYNESDLLVAETLARGWLRGLQPAEMAAMASTFVFESRGPVKIAGRLPTSDSQRAYGKIVRLEQRIKEREEQLGLDLTRGTEAGFAEVVYRWCRGAELDEVVDEDLTAGDFIRSVKQTVDLLRQLEESAGDPEVRASLAAAIEGLNRGVVAYTGVI
ncbi:MAG: DEAD/DEAH box helicase [Actinomycetota bacterium]